ncbi:glutamate racemase [Modicisalibacter ilicicola DSM 19980]|uniref:Glutamate racemase n=1 Tax=Modicisalibacter ilicicola DSM 19980 TaxID=1121942 RepID=A0A1M4YB85_9GAMM|nr:glutamate racemase [Halomonas ilicicola]SHF02876.1 glutamate racemase [Halomonas ilicicola DSM 19980]
MSGPILVFDSGVGGLSVVAAIRQRLPGAALAYACDNAMLPYGTKPDAWLVARIADVCCAAAEASRAVALVVACNTASTLALQELRSRLSIPVIGTVPAIKPAAAATRSGVFGLLATSATVRRPYTEALIRDFAAHCRVVRVAADGLVAQAERKLKGLPLDRQAICRELAPFWEIAALDTVVLGCTHFPLLTDALSACAPGPVAWVDSGDAIARRVASVVAEIAIARGAGPAWATAPEPGLDKALNAHGFAASRPLAALPAPLSLR